MSNITPPGQSPTPNKPTKPNQPRILLTQQTTPLSKLPRTLTWNVAKKIIINFFATGLFVYGGYLVYTDKPEPGMAAIGTAVAISTSKQEDQDKQNSQLESLQRNNESLQEWNEYYENLIDFCEEQEKLSEGEKNNLKREIIRLEIELESRERVAKLERENAILITENKYLKILPSQYQLPESKNQEFKPQEQNINQEQIESNDSESQS